MTGKSSLMNQTFKPRKVVLKEANRLGILLQARDRMNSDSGTAECVIATSAAADGDGPNRTSTEGDTSNGSTAKCNEDADGTSAKRNEANGKTADRHNTTCQAATREPAGRHVAHGEDGAGVSTHLPAYQIWTDSNSP